MNYLRRGLAALCFCLLLPACSSLEIKPPPTMACSLKTYSLAVEHRGEPLNVSGGAGSFGDLIDDNLLSESGEPVQGGEGDTQPVSRSMLFLSGGSQHGAFGAGYLDEWRRHLPGGRLPRFKMVTGVSTGAILATFAFLNRTEDAITGYSIVHESELLNPLVPMKHGEPSVPLGYVKLLKGGAVADLAPLRETIGKYINEGTLLAVAEETSQPAGRQLLVGVVDVDTGEAVAIDLGELARRYAAAGAGSPGRKQARDCYIESIIASSSAPMAALPVFLDNRMYVDGGARFGMFTDEIGERLERSSADLAQKPTFYLIINGDQRISRRCGKADSANCAATDDPDPTGNVDGEHEPWTFLALAVRSEKILANQVYRFSADRVQAQARDRGYLFEVAKIGPDMPDHPYLLDDPLLGPSERKTCQDWGKADVASEDPVQFFPRYMRCVIDYGREAARKDNWHDGV